MPTHYLIIFSMVLLVLQLLLWLFNRALRWQFDLSARTYWITTVLSFIGANALLVLSITRQLGHNGFRYSALMLALLLFCAMVALSVWQARKVITQRLPWRVIASLAFCGLIGLSLYNAYVPVVRYYQVQLDKPMPATRIAMVSDLHLGVLIGNRQLDKLVEIVQREKADLVLIPGDLMDDNVIAYRNENMHDHLSKLRAPLGVYATLGNHDNFGAQVQIAQEIEKAGIRLLVDDSVVINNQFTLIGRNDNTEAARATTESLLAKVDTTKPVILLDHQPTDILQHSQMPIDIQVSGHAHNGQIFPANLIVKMMYLLAYGYEKFGNGHYFVSSGYGFWGVPMRLGSQAEVVVIDVTGK